MSKAAPSRMERIVHKLFPKEKPPATIPSPPSPEEALASSQFEFGEPRDVPAPSADPRPDPEPDPEFPGEETRGEILDMIPMDPDEPEIRLVEKISAFCTALQQTQYLEAVQPLVQAGLEINLDHWGEIHEKLEENRPVEAEEARRIAEAIDAMLFYAPKAHWQTIRMYNQKHLCALQSIKDGPIEEDWAKEACLQGIGSMIHELKDERKIFDQARLAVSRGEVPSMESSDLALARKTAQELLESHRDPRAKAPSQGRPGHSATGERKPAQACDAGQETAQIPCTNSRKAP